MQKGAGKVLKYPYICDNKVIVWGGRISKFIVKDKLLIVMREVTSISKSKTGKDKSNHSESNSFVMSQSCTVTVTAFSSFSNCSTIITLKVATATN